MEKIPPPHKYTMDKNVFKFCSKSYYIVNRLVMKIRKLIEKLFPTSGLLVNLINHIISLDRIFLNILM